MMVDQLYFQQHIKLSWPKVTVICFLLTPKNILKFLKKHGQIVSILDLVIFFFIKIACFDLEEAA